MFHYSLLSNYKIAISSYLLPVYIEQDNVLYIKSCSIFVCTIYPKSVRSVIEVN